MAEICSVVCQTVSVFPSVVGPSYQTSSLAPDWPIPDK